MGLYIALLRGINVGGKNKLKMADLRALFESLGFKNIKTYLQSGNILFESNDARLSKLETIISEKITESFSLQVQVLVRTISDMEHILRSNPFLQDKEIDFSQLYVTFLQKAQTLDNLNKLPVPAGETAEFIPGENEIFLRCPNGYGRTKLTNNFFERKIKVPATTRNWKTVRALCKIARE